MDIKHDWYQIIAITSSCLGSLTAGILFSWTSQAIPKIVNDKVNYNITLEEASYFTVIPPISMILSCLPISKLMNIIGRKKTLYLMIIPQSLSFLLIATTRSLYWLYLSRFVCGFGDATLFVVLPSYIGEISTPKVRGVWGNFITLFIYIGQFLTNLIGIYVDDVQIAAYICLSIPLLMACTFIFMPESPYFYIINNREEDARKSLKQLRRKTNVDEELEILKKDVSRQLSESGKWKDLFMIKSNRKALFAGIFLRASQQLGGISSFAVYTQYIFLKSGGNFSPSTSTLVWIGLITILNLVAAYTLDIFGRRKSYFYSLALCSVTLLSMSAYFYLDDFTNIDVSFINWFPLAGMIAFTVFYSFGLGIVPTLMLGELFSASVKDKGLSVLTIIFGILVSTVTKLFQLLESNFGFFSPFLMFGLCCLVSTFLSLYVVPETKGKTLEEIQQSLKSKKPQKDEAS